MAQSSTARRSSGMKSKSTNQKRQASTGSRTAGSGRSSDNSRSSGSNGRSGGSSRSSGNNRSDSSSSRSGRNSSQGQNQRASVMRPSSGTMERGVSSSASGLSSPRRFQPDSDHYFEKFFLDQLKDIYYAEQKITQGLQEMQEAATTDELKEAFEEHLFQTQRHVRRLEKVFNILGQKPEGKKCEAIEGIIREAQQIVKETEEDTITRDAALIMAAQKVEHYEIATYGGLVQMAITMGEYEIAELLDRTLIEEEDTDLLLTEIAECEINIMAEFEGINAEEGEEGAEEESEEDEEEETGGENMSEKDAQREV